MSPITASCDQEQNVCSSKIAVARPNPSQNYADVEAGIAEEAVMLSSARVGHNYIGLTSA